MSPEPAANGLQSIDVLILAGGLGTRIRSVLGDTPKVLASIGGSPFLDYLLLWLLRFQARRVVLSLGYLAASVCQHLQDNPANGLAIETVIEPRPLGTAGAIRFARAQLRSDPVLLVNGDTFVDCDPRALLARHRALGVPATLLCTEVIDAGRYGRVVLDAGGRIDSFVEKDPSHHGVALVNAGISVLSAVLLDQIAEGNAVSLEQDIFHKAPSGSLGALAGAFTFIDIGTPESLKAAEAVLQPLVKLDR